MPVEFRCTNCRRRLRVPRRWAGDAIDCPRCAAKIVVPQQAGVSQGGVFESKSFERSLRKLDPPRKSGEDAEAAAEGVWDAASLAELDTAVLTPVGEPAAWSPRSDRATLGRRRRRRAVGLLASLAIAALASAAVIAAFWLFKQ